MAEVVSEALETLQRQIDNLRDDLHGRIDKLVDEINDIPHNLCFRLKSLEDRLASKPDDFGGVTSTGAPRRGEEEAKDA